MYSCVNLTIAILEKEKNISNQKKWKIIFVKFSDNFYYGFFCFLSSSFGVLFLLRYYFFTFEFHPLHFNDSEFLLSFNVVC